MATAVTKSLSGTITTYTVSAWVKKSPMGQLGYIFNAGSGGLAFTGDKIKFQSSGTPTTTAKYQDPSAWYHLCVSCSSGTSTLYVNGVSALTSGSDCSMSGNIYVGGYDSTPEYPFLGLMSHFHFIDGTAYAPTVFASTDSTSGIWNPITGPSVTYGTNGFFLKMEDSSNLDLDSSSNTHTMTTIGTLTATKDNPTNNFCTLNPIGIDVWTLSCGATKISGASDNQMMISTMHSDAGYFELKIPAPDGSQGYGMRVGLAKVDGGNELTYSGIGGASGDLERFIGVQNTPGNYKAIYNGGVTVTDWTGNTSTVGDIVMVAWKDNKIWYGYNGSWLGSGNPSAGTNEADTLTSGSWYMPAIISSLAGANGVEFNFGNGYFGTTAVSSAESDGAGFGAFEYAPPTGTYALCSKNLAEYG